MLKSNRDDTGRLIGSGLSNVADAAVAANTAEVQRAVSIFCQDYESELKENEIMIMTNIFITDEKKASAFFG